MRDITLMPNDYIVTHIKTDTICEHFDNDDVVYAVDERIVPLVRCKDCKHYSIEGETTHFGWCGYWNKPTDEMRYCSDGERDGE